MVTFCDAERGVAGRSLEVTEVACLPLYVCFA